MEKRQTLDASNEAKALDIITVIAIVINNRKWEESPLCALMDVI